MGFLLTALCVGLAVRLWPGNTLALCAAMAVGMLLCYACGTAWFVVVYTRNSGPIGVMGALNLCVIPFLVPDAVKCALAVLLAQRLRKHVHL